jgi:teichuronic acid exporter
MESHNKSIRSFCYIVESQQVVTKIQFQQTYIQRTFCVQFKYFIDINYSSTIYNLIIGRNYSDKVLGYYTNADQYSSLPSTSISSITSKVSYPVLSEMQNNDELLRSSIKKLITNVMYISFVIMFGLAAIAKPLFIIVLGEKWLPSVVMFQVLCIAYAITPMHGINHNLMKIKGRSDLFLKTEMIKYLILTPLLVLGAIFGINVLIAGIVLFYWIGYVINAMYSKRLLGYSIIAQTIDFLPVMIVALVPAILTWSLDSLFSMKYIVLLVIQILLYTALVMLISIFFKVPAYFELKQILSDKLTVSNFIKTIKGT